MNKKRQFGKNLYNKKTISCILAAMFLLSDVTMCSAAAVSVVESVQSTAASLRNKAKEIADKRNNIVYLSQVKQWIEENKADYQKALMDEKSLYEELATAQKDLLTAKDQLVESQQKAPQATEYLLKVGYDISDTAKLIIQIEAEIARLEKAEKAAQAAAIAKERSVEADIKNFTAQVEKKKANLAAQILAKVGYDENDLEDAEALLEQAVTNESSVLSAKEQNGAQQIAAAYSRLDVISKQLAETYKHQEAAYSVHSEVESRKHLTEMEKYVTNLKTDILDTQEYLKTLQRESKELQDDLESTEKQLQPPTAAKYADTQTKFYTWHDNKGNSGQQLYQPISFYTLDGTTELGLSSGYINSRVDNTASFSGLTDTNLYVGKISRVGSYTLTYMMNVNLPTANSKTPAGAIVSDDLVEYSRLGEGLNWAPGLRVSKQIGEEDTWSAEASYNIRGSYQYDPQLPGVKIAPGDELSKSISWQHAGQDWQFLGTLSHANYTKTKENDLNYRDGNNYDIQATYNKVLTPQDDLMLYYWYSSGNKTNYYSPLNFDPGGGLYRHYLGTQWQRKLNENSQFNVMFNTMFSTGSNYDPLTYLSVNERNKYGLRLGYSLQLSTTDQISFQVERFYMHDKDQDTDYRGNNFYLTYSKNL